HTLIAIALGQKHELDGAIKEYRAALEIDPANVNAHLGLGLTLEAKGNLPAALDEYRRALALDPDSETGKEGIDRVAKLLGKK
ncbi:MAG: tetratricopeptide repeat protein, partial [Candidatus Binataceae bacterium]